MSFPLGVGACSFALFGLAPSLGPSGQPLGFLGLVSLLSFSSDTRSTFFVGLAPSFGLGREAFGLDGPSTSFSLGYDTRGFLGLPASFVFGADACSLFLRGLVSSPGRARERGSLLGSPAGLVDLFVLTLDSPFGAKRSHVIRQTQARRSVEIDAQVAGRRFRFDARRRVAVAPGRVRAVGW